eukprot:4641861-Pleurochrysis_carterae.AAC.1
MRAPGGVCALLSREHTPAEPMDGEEGWAPMTSPPRPLAPGAQPNRSSEGRLVSYYIDDLAGREVIRRARFYA